MQALWRIAQQQGSSTSPALIEISNKFRKLKNRIDANNIDSYFADFKTQS